MMAHATAHKPTPIETCSTCPDFNNYNDSRGNGWCSHFDQYAKATWEKANDCIISSQTTTANIEVIELDRDGYPMGEQTVENAYHNPNFVTYPNEPF